jgi:hypothetical protein
MIYIDKPTSTSKETAKTEPSRRSGPAVAEQPYRRHGEGGRPLQQQHRDPSSVWSMALLSACGR